MIMTLGNSSKKSQISLIDQGGGRWRRHWEKTTALTLVKQELHPSRSRVQEGEAYIKEATVVVLATSCNCGAGRPWLRRILRADLQVKARTRPSWSSTRDILVMKKKM